VSGVATVLPKLRTLELAPARFRTIATAAACGLLVIVATGATVRLTDSGLGCEHWPGCTKGNPLPAKDYHAFVEYGNRVISAFTIGLTLVSWLAAYRTFGLPRAVRRLAAAAFLGTLAQAPLGAITVYSHLNPLLVMTHLFLSLIVLAIGVVVAVEAWRLATGGVEPYVPGRAQRGILLLAALNLGLLVSGAFVTAAGPHPGGVAVRRLWSFEPAVWLHVRVTAAFAIAFLVALAYLWRNRERWPGLYRAGVLVFGLLIVQMAIGELQYRTKLPWWLVLAHVVAGTAVWAGIVALAALFRRPIAALAPRPR
jgi:cytochrome c oxidase assembly protein subunit 15